MNKCQTASGWDMNQTPTGTMAMAPWKTIQDWKPTEDLQQ